MVDEETRQAGPDDSGREPNVAFPALARDAGDTVEL
jgi:hypothetical protein